MRDTYEGISLPYLAQNARVNAAAAATLALAPPPPGVLSDRNQPMITRAPSGYDANLKWTAVAGRGRLPHLLARSVGSRTGSTTSASAT